MSEPRFEELCAGLLAAGRAVRFSAPGPSMEPTLHDGDALLVEPFSAADARVGDILVYLAPRGLVAHRLVGRKGASLLLRGDAPSSGTESVAAGQVLGRVAARVRGGRERRLDTSWERHAYPLRRLGLAAWARVRRLLR